MFFNKFNLQSRNLNLIGFAELIVGFIFYLPIIALYLEQELFSITNVALILSVQAFATSVLEIPTGAIADLFGRKRTYVLAQIIFLSGLILLYIGGSLSTFIAFALITALGGALMSGTDDAIIYDTLKAENKEQHYKHIRSILGALWPLGAIIGSLAGGYFATISIKLPILLSFIPLGIALLLSLFIQEPSYHKEEHKNVAKQMWSATKLVGQSPQLLFIILVSVIFMMFGETTHVLKALYLDFKDIPLHYFGLIFGLTFGLSSVGHFFSHHISEKLGNKLTLLLAGLAFPLGLILSALTQGILSMTFLVLTAVAFGVRNPIMSDFLHKQIPSSKRATIISINNLLVSAGMGIGGPLIGYLADLYTINTAFIISALLMCSGIIFVLLLKEH